MRNSVRILVGLLSVVFAVVGFGSVSAGTKPYVNDASFGANGLVTGKVGPADTASTLGARVFASDSRGRVIVGAASGGR